MKKIIGFYIILFCLDVTSSAQQVVSSGGYEVKSGITVDWMLGGSLSEITVNDPASLLKAMEAEQAGTEVRFKVYPIPATGFINIESGIADTSKLAVELFNDAGIKILSRKLTNQPLLQINISDIPAGIYLLKVTMISQEQPFWVKKILKN
jgi:hypothetical protein